MLMNWKVYYKKDPAFRLDENLTKADLEKTHVFVKEVAGENEEDVMCQMQAENWSPNGEARPLIRSLGLRHTSMSIGDVVVNEYGRAFQCDIIGWKEIF